MKGTPRTLEYGQNVHKMALLQDFAMLMKGWYWIVKSRCWAQVPY